MDGVNYETNDRGSKERSKMRLLSLSRGAILLTWIIFSLLLTQTANAQIFKERQKLTPDDTTPAVRTYFGSSVAIYGDTAVIGAPSDMSTPYRRSGSAYVFQMSSDGRWLKRQKLTCQTGGLVTSLEDPSPSTETLL